MKKICCTIVTPSHIYKGITTLRSIYKYDDEVNLYLVVTEPVDLQLENIQVLHLDAILQGNKSGRTISKVYAHQMDFLRWSSKPIVMRHLLEQFPEATVIYCDCDLCFFAKPTHLYSYIEQGSIVLTPMWRPTVPYPDLDEFRGSFTDGFFNAGCVTANTKGLVALDWWATACISGCEINPMRGLFLDQRYLDLLILYFPGTVVCEHKGYNVADWNVQIRNEYLESNQDLKELFQIMLIHFTANTMKRIERGGDPILEPYLEEYRKYLDESVTILEQVASEGI